MDVKPPDSPADIQQCKHQEEHKGEGGGNGWVAATVDKRARDMTQKAKQGGGDEDDRPGVQQS